MQRKINTEKWKVQKTRPFPLPPANFELADHTMGTMHGNRPRYNLRNFLVCYSSLQLAYPHIYGAFQ